LLRIWCFSLRKTRKEGNETEAWYLLQAREKQTRITQANKGAQSLGTIPETEECKAVKKGGRKGGCCHHCRVELRIKREHREQRAESSVPTKGVEDTVALLSRERLIQ
jgi:hypothetical protein